MKNPILFLMLAATLSSCNSILVITPGDLISMIVIYLAVSYVLAGIYCIDGKHTFNKYFFVNLFLTPILGTVYYKMTKNK